MGSVHETGIVVRQENSSLKIEHLAHRQIRPPRRELEAGDNLTY